MKKKNRNKNNVQKKFKIGDKGTILVDRRTIPVEVVDIDHALQEYRCWPLYASESRIFWRTAREIRRFYGQ